MEPFQDASDLPLSQRHCQPCTLGTRAMTPTDIAAWLSKIPRWKKITVDSTDRIQRHFHFNSFRSGADFAYKLAALADREDHHPSVLVEWDGVTVTWWTHRTNGLHINDFIMAAKTDLLAAHTS